MLNNATAKHPMIRGYMPPFRTGLLVLVLLACRDKGGSNDSTRTLPPVFSSGPASSTNWDVDAGPLMLVSLGGSADSGAVVLPEVTDSTIASAQTDSVPVGGLVFDLFGRRKDQRFDYGDSCPDDRCETGVRCMATCQSAHCRPRMACWLCTRTRAGDQT